MFALAILIGVYSYSLFILGVISLLYPVTVIFISVLWVLAVIWWFRKEGNFPKTDKLSVLTSIKKTSLFSKICLILIFLIWLINFIGTLAPEVSFDALWYHLTIPKIFVDNNSVFYIPGGLYYYSVMPKLVDMLYIPAVMLNSALAAKLIHFSFGILSLVVLYKISRAFLSQSISLFVLLIFSSNLVVSWLATTAYIDLGRTFFELMSVYGIVLYIKEKKELWLVESAVMAGFAISTKIIAAGSLAVLVPVLLYLFRKDIAKGIKFSIYYVLIAVFITSPYLIFSWLNTGNPIYPIFSEFYARPYEGTSFFSVPIDIWRTFVTGDDPINPIYIMSLPFIFLVLRKLSRFEKIFVIYALFSFLVWMITPQTGGGRYLLPYLPILSVLVGFIVKYLENKTIKNLIIIIGFVVALTTVGYRTLASTKYFDLILGKQSQEEYLKNNLNFSFGDFYDTTGYFSKTLNDGDKVLVYGLHNLWYADFSFIHESYVRTGDEFNYILAPTDMVLPERFKLWREVFTDHNVGVTLYTLGGGKWVY